MLSPYYSFIEDNLQIKNKDAQVVPFILWNVQDKYLIELTNHYGKNLTGVRDIILKARKEGFSSLILAIFATDFFVSDRPIGSITVADNRAETQKLLERGKFFIECAAQKHNRTLDDICESVTSSYLKSKVNGAEWFIGTAGSKVALRTETIQNAHFSEAAHFPDTDIITARETIEGASQMVDMGKGRIFIESTANGYGNYFQTLEEKAYKGSSQFRSCFFSAEELYSREWLEKKAKEFTTHEMYKQEYPSTREEAYMSSGSKFFDVGGIKHLQEQAREPAKVGTINSYGEIM